MSSFRPLLRVLGLISIASLWNQGGTATADMPTLKAKPAAIVKPAVNHSAPYTRLLGTAWPADPVKFAVHQSASTAKPKTPAQTIGWHHRAYPPYYAGYAPYGYGYSYGVPYYAGYGGTLGYGYNYYQPWSYSYQPWIGGWSGYPYYSSFAPGFGSYYSVGYRGGVGNYGAGYPGFGAYGGSPGYGGFGGCCYW